MAVQFPIAALAHLAEALGLLAGTTVEEPAGTQNLSSHHYAREHLRLERRTFAGGQHPEVSWVGSGLAAFTTVTMPASCPREAPGRPPARVGSPR